MPRLSGSLARTGLPALFRFLGDLLTTGRLDVGESQWNAQVYLDHGRVVAARFGAARGLAAIDDLALVLPTATFELHDAAPPAERDEQLAAMAPADLATHLEETVAGQNGSTAGLPPPDARLRVTEPAEWSVTPAGPTEPAGPAGPAGADGDQGGSLTVTRRALSMLLEIRDEQPTVAALAAQWGVRPALDAVGQLLQLHLVRVDSQDGAASNGVQASEAGSAKQAIA